MTRINTRIVHMNGIPLGGIGTGSIEILPNGCFHDWQIFNMGIWSPKQPEEAKTLGPDMGPEALRFFIRTRKDNEEPHVCQLSMNFPSDQNDLQALSWIKRVEEIDYDGKFPVARLNYHERDLPISVEAIMHSPIIPHDSRTSGTPGFYTVFKLKNNSKGTVEASMLGILQNPVAYGLENRSLENTITHKGNVTYLNMKTGNKGTKKATEGSMCLSVSGGENSWIKGEFGRYMKGYIVFGSAFGTFHESIFHNFRASGRLQSLDGDASPAAYMNMADEEIERMSSHEKRSLIEKLQQYPFVNDFIKTYLYLDGSILEQDENLDALLKEIRLRIKLLEAWDNRRQNWGDGALASSIRLLPGEEKDIVFTLSWYFPNHFNPAGMRMGHMYENWFKDAEDVNHFLTSNFRTHHVKITDFAETLYDTSMEGFLSEAWESQLSTLVKSSWWTRNNEFAIWEGLGCCGLHTTDITYQGSFPIIAMFPDLQKLQMEMGVRFQREDGKVHHMFLNDLSVVDNDFHRVDMNNQFVMLVCRDYLWTGDLEYAKRLWPNIISAMDSMERHDTDGDGLPDQDTRYNTYDLWNFFGSPSYICSLWLSALHMGIRLAKDVGDEEHMNRWQSILNKGVGSYVRKLWNGEYYSLWVDGEKRDEVCMTDQLDGEWFTQLVGLGRCLPHDKTVAALKAIYKYNFRRDDGLIIGTYPEGKTPRFFTYGNFQAISPFTGIEYALASLMIEVGLLDEAMEIVRNISERYVRVGRIWNQHECGEHYYRAMCSWSILLSMSGFKIDMPEKTVMFTPVMRDDEFSAPWISSTGWGIFKQSDNVLEIICKSGELCFEKMRLNINFRIPSVELDDVKLEIKSAIAEDGTIFVDFGRSVTIRQGSRLEISR